MGGTSGTFGAGISSSGGLTFCADVPSASKLLPSSATSVLLFSEPPNSPPKKAAAFPTPSDTQPTISPSTPPIAPRTSATKTNGWDNASMAGTTKADRIFPIAETSGCTAGKIPCTRLDTAERTGCITRTTVPNTCVSGGRTVPASSDTRLPRTGRTEVINGMNAEINGPAALPTADNAAPRTGSSCPATCSTTGMSG